MATSAGDNGAQPVEEQLREPYGLIGIMVTAGMLFVTFTASYLIRRTGADWKPLEMPRVLWGSSAVLVLSSVTMEFARRGRRGGLAVTGALGLVFLILQLVAWRQLAEAGVFVPTHPHSSFFYVLTGVHGLHLVGGLLALAVLAARNRHVGACAVWWHFMAIVWFYLFFLLSFF